MVWHSGCKSANIRGVPKAAGAILHVMKWLLICAAIAVVALVIDRLMVAAEARGWVYWRRGPTSGSLSAAALSPLHTLTQPSYEYVVQARDREHTRVVTNEDGEPPEPGARAARPERPQADGPHADR